MASNPHPSRQKVAWLDLRVSPGSPSMQHLVASLPFFESSGINIGIICSETLPRLEDRILAKIPVPLARLKPLQSILFSIRCLTTRADSIRSLSAGRLLHATGANSQHADLISIHFLPADYFWIVLKSARLDWREWLRLPFIAAAGILESFVRTHPGIHFHTVSRALGDSLAEKGIHKDNIHVIPTPYDPTTYSVAFRKANRESARATCGFSPAQKVFAFVSQGAYHRKGLYKAIEICCILRQKGHDAHLMIIGGNGAPWERMHTTARARYPDSTNWLHITGFVQDLPHTLAAADAFLMPSLYEGFAAVEVEAAAMGLPLCLTAHPGTEMILKDGQNGWFIDHSPPLAAATLSAAYDRILPRDTPDIGEALTLGQWQERMAEIYRLIGKSKQTL